MTDVARLAGVSVSTVSYVLTGARRISTPTRERVESAMLELSYTPNAFARSLKSKRSKIIALSFPNNDNSLGLTSLEYILGASDRAQERGYHLLLWTTDAGDLSDLAQFARQGLVNGVLVMEVQLQDGRINILRDAGLQFAMIGRPEDPTGIDFTDTDFDQCAALAIDYLVGLGHRHLGLVNHAASAVGAGRGDAVRLLEAIRRSGRQAGAEISALPCANSTDAGRQVVRELIRMDPDLTGVIVLNVQAAAGILASAMELGWNVPRDFSLVSLLMTGQAATLTIPALTTVSPSGTAIGRFAVDTLIMRLEGELEGVRQQLFECELTVRGSSGPPRADR
jgi:DNA-binding LacI/PurR family transcriptional regulator